MIAREKAESILRNAISIATNRAKDELDEKVTITCGAGIYLMCQDWNVELYLNNTFHDSEVFIIEDNVLDLANEIFDFVKNELCPNYNNDWDDEEYYDHVAEAYD